MYNQYKLIKKMDLNFIYFTLFILAVLILVILIKLSVVM